MVVVEVVMVVVVEACWCGGGSGSVESLLPEFLLNWHIFSAKPLGRPDY